MIEILMREGSIMEMARSPDMYTSVFRLCGLFASHPPLAGLLHPMPDQAFSLSRLLCDLAGTSSIFLKHTSVDDMGDEEGAKGESLEQKARGLAVEIAAAWERVLPLTQDVDAAATKGGSQDEDGEINVRAAYEEEMSDLLLDESDIQEDDSFKYKGKLEQLRKDSAVSKERMVRLAQEVSAMCTALPATWDSLCAVRVDETGPDAFRFIITGPTGTPYESGCFAFDVFIPSTYPKTAPSCNLMTTGSGAVRFNPNLYSCGKVFLSLLGTWGGQANESWDPVHSSLLQLIVSIQSLILIDQPYFNEPSYERRQGTPAGTKYNRAYSNIVRYATVKHAMLDQIKKPTEGFEDVISTHFKAKRDAVLATVHQWLADAEAEEQGATDYGDLVSSHNGRLAGEFRKKFEDTESKKGRYYEMLKEAIEELEDELGVKRVPKCACGKQGWHAACTPAAEKGGRGVEGGKGGVMGGKGGPPAKGGKGMPSAGKGKGGKGLTGKGGKGMPPPRGKGNKGGKGQHTALYSWH